MGKRTSEPGYATVHYRVINQRGSARAYGCMKCGGRADCWAYDHTDPAERFDIHRRHAFSLDLHRYWPLCFSCHSRLDIEAGPVANRTHCKYGHEFTPENTYRPPGRTGRECRTCMAANRRNRYARMKAGAAITTTVGAA